MPSQNLHIFVEDHELCGSVIRGQDKGDYATALQEWRPLAEQGDAHAQFQLGNMYSLGKGVPKDDAEALKWYRKAAEQGYVNAQLNLGVMYYFGGGVPVNSVKAYMWWSLAKAQGNEDAAKGLYIIEKEMTPAEITKAQALADEWWEKHNN